MTTENYGWFLAGMLVTLGVIYYEAEHQSELCRAFANGHAQGRIDQAVYLECEARAAAAKAVPEVA